MEHTKQHKTPSAGRRFLGLLVTFFLGGTAGAAVALTYLATYPQSRLAGMILAQRHTSLSSKVSKPDTPMDTIPETSQKRETQEVLPHSQDPPSQLPQTSPSILAKGDARPLRSVDVKKSPEDFRDPALQGTSPQTFAVTDSVLLNGGGQPDSNYFSHHLFLEMLHELLPLRGLNSSRLTVFSTDGDSPDPDRMLVNNVPFAWLYEGLNEHQMIMPAVIQNTSMKGQKLHPAKRRDLGRWFRRYAREIKRREKPSTLFLFVTDHGTKGKGPLGNKIELWRESINVGQLRDVMRPLGKKNRVVTVMSQCYSGGFANLLYDGPGRVHGNRCGFFSTIATREAYGCFPETARSSRVGHAYRMIHAMQTAQTFAEAHRQTLLTDEAPDVPLATSDVYLEDILRRRARQKKRRISQEVDRWLRQVRWDGPQKQWRADVRLLRRLERRFGLRAFSHTADVWKALRESREMQKRLQKLEALWEQVLGEMRRGAMVRFYQENTGLSAKIEREMNRPGLDEQTFALGKDIHKTYLRFLKGKREFALLKRLYRRYGLVNKKVYHLHIKEAALLRVRNMLVRIAGRVYLEKSGTSKEKADLQALLECEATSLGKRTVPGSLRAEGPQTAEKIDPLMASIERDAYNTPIAALLPSQLGIAFQPTNKGWHPRFSKLAPGSVVVNEVASDSPAEKAGLQVGDVIVSVGGQMLQFPGEIRDHVMLAKSDKKIYFMIARKGRFRTVPVTLRAMTEDPQALAMAPQPSPPQGFPKELMGPEDGEPDFEEDTRPQKVEPYRLPPRTRGNQATGLRDLRGQSLSIPAKGAKATLLFFWATWCEGCKSMVPLLRDLRRKYRGSGLKIYAVTSDETPMIRTFMQQWGKKFPFQVALDEGGRLSRKYNISSIPQLILYDQKGEMKLHVDRPSAGFEEKLASQIQSLVQ
ncbi:MAG: redoxin domain-containing protein [Myxococcales bacterium]|nr:redoxin domain-containing protein [Myxococcales bacterium]